MKRYGICTRGRALGCTVCLFRKSTGGCPNMVSYNQVPSRSANPSRGEKMLEMIRISDDVIVLKGAGKAEGDLLHRFMSLFTTPEPQKASPTPGPNTTVREVRFDNDGRMSSETLATIFAARTAQAIGTLESRGPIQYDTLRREVRRLLLNDISKQKAYSYCSPSQPYINAAIKACGYKIETLNIKLVVRA